MEKSGGLSLAKNVYEKTNFMAKDKTGGQSIYVIFARSLKEAYRKGMLEIKKEA